ncbi:MAG: hypothetical protein LBR70_04180 [Lactobacillaceae bacterium]|jgi:hypothetical protein|nr:hypothetical protein [Lactobacillaceae bacterium]
MKTLTQYAAVLFFTMFSFSAQAQTDTSGNSIEDGMAKAVEAMEDALVENVPVLADSMTDFFSEMIRMMAPMLISLEENKKLPKASNEMAEKIKNAINAKYNRDTSYIIDLDTNSIEFDGMYKEGDTVLRYRLTRNLSLVLVTYDLIKKEGIYTINISGIDEGNGSSIITNLDDENIDVGKLKANKINNHEYIGYSSKNDKQIYLVTNIGSYLILQIQVKGSDFGGMTKDFIYSLDFAALKEAVADDGKNIEDIKQMIEEQIKDTNKIDELFEKQNQGL